MEGEKCHLYSTVLVQYNLMHYNINTIMFQVSPGDTPQTMLKTQCMNLKETICGV